MMWILFAVAAPLLWAATNVLDTHLVRERAIDASVLLLITGLFSATPAVVTTLLGAWGWPGVGLASAAALTGSLGLLVYYPYLRALEHESASSVILMWNLAPVLIVAIAHWSIGETLRLHEYLAIVLLVGSSLLAGAKRAGGWRLSSAMPWMVAASFLLAGSSVLEKAVYEQASFGVGLSWMSLGSAATTLLLWRMYPGAGREATSLLAGRSARLLVANEGLDVAAVVSLQFATSMASVSLVHALGGLQPVFVLIIAGFVAPRSAPRRRDWSKTVAATVLAVVGIALVHSRL